MAVEYIRTFTTTCPNELIEAINDDVAITPTLMQIINSGGADSSFWFSATLGAGEEVAFDDILDAWTCPTTGDGTVIGGDGQTLCDTCPADPGVVWSSEYITNNFSGRDRIVIQHNGDTYQTFQSTFVNVQFDVASRIDSSYYTYDANDGSFTIVNEGCYLVMAGIAIEATSTSRNSSVAELRVDGGALDGSKSYGFHYADQSQQTLTARGVIHVTAGQKVQVFVARDWGKSTLQTLPNSCRMTIISVDGPPA